MSTEMQIKANRKNAQKSTGPRTEEGKDVVSQNAVKHGLCAAKNVIKTESQDEYNFFRDNMFDDLSPQGAMEEMLAERIVSLSWRLKRAEHFQNAVIDALIEYGLHESVMNWHSDSTRRAQKDAEAGNMDIILGIVINKDFANSRTLDMLLSYERRIESSLYRATSELRKLRRSRQEEDTEYRMQDTENRTQNTVVSSQDVKQSQNDGFQPEILNSNLEIRNNTKSQNTNLEKFTEVFAASAADVEKQTQSATGGQVCRTNDQILSTRIL